LEKLKRRDNKVGLISISIPEEIFLEYTIEEPEDIQRILSILHTKSNPGSEKENDIVGIWKNRFPEFVESKDIKKTWRSNLWKRF